MNMFLNHNSIKIFIFSLFLFLIVFPSIIKSQNIPQESGSTSEEPTRIVAICGDGICAYPEDSMICPEDCAPSHEKTEKKGEITDSFMPPAINIEFIFIVIFVVFFVILLILVYKRRKKKSEAYNKTI